MDVRDRNATQRVPTDAGLLLAAVEASGEAVLITSAELEEPGPRIEYVNPAFTRMTGYKAEECVFRRSRPGIPI
ncbi:hypothetical protein MET9862_01503 [Methylobacterium symbioticum]|uniref:PAS domain-containing protein n=1 Tax=Methylobacterium symbioticum TaxID=2584084 RepID=A0A509EBT6_9HYPH|nr:hypothetical protein MET9862_01503 [Methylobacterium symbioticum]